MLSNFYIDVLNLVKKTFKRKKSFYLIHVWITTRLWHYSTHQPIEASAQFFPHRIVNYKRIQNFINNGSWVFKTISKTVCDNMQTSLYAVIYLQFCLSTIENHPFSGTSPLICTYPWLFYKRAHGEL